MSEPPAEPTVTPRARPGRKPFVVLLLMLVLAGIAWFAMEKISEMASIQDCAMSGRSNCAPIDTGR